MKKNYFYLSLVAFIFLFSSCKKEKENYTSTTLNNYYPLQTGKSITYKLDSLVFLEFGQLDTTISYEAKYVVDSLITDNLGRPAYRIFRFIRKQSPDTWMPSGTFLAINTTASLEFIENNLRYIKLELPVENGYSWKGNVFIDTQSLNSELKYMDDWDYTYDSVGVAVTLGAFNLDNTLTVRQRDEVVGTPGDPGAYSEVNYGEEKYAAGIGLVYRRFFHSEYQPGTGGSQGYIADGSYGITLTMIDHN